MCDLEHGRKNITQKNIQLLTLLLDINSKWLRSGVGDIFIEKDANTSILDMTTNILKNDNANFKKEFLFYLSKLDDKSWKAIETIYNTIRHQVN